jgi:type II secretory pathway pseudopilin PulG
MKSETGFSIIEVLVAVLLIGVALVPLMQLFPGLLAENQTDEATMRLGAAAGRQMESLVNALRGNIAGATSGSSGCPDLPGCLLVWTITQEASSTTPGVGTLVDILVIACVNIAGSGRCDPGGTQVEEDAKVTSRP